MKYSNEVILSVRDLVVTYKSDRHIAQAVNHVSFDLHRGETLGFVGETGAGKTTIAKSIMRILPDPPAEINSGEIIYEGEDLLKLPESKMQAVRGNKISMVFQDPMTALNPTMRIGEQIEEVIKLHQKGVSSKERAREMLELVGIPGSRSEEYPHQFSGGMKQRVVIAMAMACNPELLIEDEPTTALDVTIQAQVLKLMSELKEKLHTSVILITHNLGVVAETCDNVAVIYAGEIVEYGTTEQVFDHPTHPYTKGLFGSLVDLDNIDRPLMPIKGQMPDPFSLPKGCKFQERCQLVGETCSCPDIPFIEVEKGHYCRCIMEGIK